MKSTSIDFTEEFDDLMKVAKLGRFLLKLKVAGAEEFISDAHDLHNDTFCGDCTYHIDDCECRSTNYGGEYDDEASYED